MSKVKVNFDRELDFVEDSDNDFFKDQLIGALRGGSSTENMIEAAALNSLIGDIARSDGAVEVSEKDLEILEDNVNRLLEDKEVRFPNFLACEVAALIEEGKDKLDDN